MDQFVNTPQTTKDASRISIRSNPFDKMSPEKSFAAPTQPGDLVSQMKDAKGHGMNLKTPRAGAPRDPLRLLPNVNQRRSEFTPIMASVTKNNIARRLSSKKSSSHNTPAYFSSRTPANRRLSDLSRLDGENTSSSAGNTVDNTPMPQQPSSSALSTPIAQFSGRNMGGLVNDGNMMTLREQEGVIDKVEKENFGLKMKIHFLEEALSKRGSEFNQAALKENTSLKVDQLTLQRELSKFKRYIAQAERDAELYRLQLEEYKEKIRRKQVDEHVRAELESLRSELQKKDNLIKRLESDKNDSENQEQSEIKRLKDEVDDLQAELREKDRAIDERDDQIDGLKMKASKESNDVAAIEDELDSVRQEVEDLKESLERAVAEAQEAREAQEQAVEEKRKAEDDLDELRDEMANKSFTTKGLSRQLEEKANKLEDDYHELQERHEDLQAELHEKSEAEKQLREKLREMEREGASDIRRLQQELELCQQQRDTLDRKLASMTKQLETAEQDLQVKVDEKNLLQIRHDALTKESAELQRDLDTAKSSLREAEAALDEERQRSALTDNALRTQHKHEIDLLHEQINGLHREINAKNSDYAAEMEEWEAQKRTLEAACQKADEKAKGLQRTVDKLQDAQGTLSNRELKLQEALQSEVQRHEQEEKVLSKQIEELQQDLAAKRGAADESRTELNNAKEELRISIREQAALKEKVAELEEEIEVLQADIEQEHEYAQRLQKTHSSDAEVQLQKMRLEKQNLQGELTTVSQELRKTQKALETSEKERDDLEAKLQAAQKANDDTFNVDQEKRELKRLKVKLEKDVARLTTERDNLAEANRALEDEVNAELERAGEEENRLQAEIDSLRNQKHASVESKDRELTSAKNKITRLEVKVKELEAMLEGQSRVIGSPTADISGLTRDLAEARKNETISAKRETDLKAANRELKMRVNDLERELHEAKLAQYKAKSPSVSPPPSNSRELAKMRQDLMDAQAEIKVLSSDNRDLKRTARRASTIEKELEELQSLLRIRTAEAETLSATAAEQKDLVHDLREQLSRMRKQKDETGNLSLDMRKRERQVNDLKTELKRLREELGRNDLSLRLSVRDTEAREMKDQLRRLREERSLANKKADAVENELEALQSRYENMLEKLSAGKSSKDEIREKEVKGLIKEIMWLKAKCKREERLRRDLAWSKGFLEQSEAMRVQCNQVDLRILGEMGVSLDSRKYESRLKPVQKFRAAVSVVIAAIRMSNMEEQWRDARLIGEELKIMRMKQTKSRSRARVLDI
ncbi:hypothetical protein KCU88_g1181, partial [Aureobasidium melanogenum]